MGMLVTNSLTHSLTHSFTHSCLLNLIDVTLACEEANTELVDVVTVANEDRVGNNLLQILKLRFGKKIKLLFRLGQFFLLMFCKGYIESKLDPGRDSEARVWSRF